jgi:hypothetical protein
MKSSQLYYGLVAFGPFPSIWFGIRSLVAATQQFWRLQLPKFSISLLRRAPGDAPPREPSHQNLPRL